MSIVVKRHPLAPQSCIFICAPANKFSRVLFAGTDPRNVSVSIPSPNGLVSSKSKIFIGIEKSLSRLFLGKEISEFCRRFARSRGSCIFTRIPTTVSCILHRSRCTHFPSRGSVRIMHTRKRMQSCAWVKNAHANSNAQNYEVNPTTSVSIEIQPNWKLLVRALYIPFQQNSIYNNYVQRALVTTVTLSLDKTKWYVNNVDRLSSSVWGTQMPIFGFNIVVV